MADVRSLLKSERAARRVQHKHASYSTGSLLCLVCHLQLKSESLWEGHLRSPGHIMRLQKLEKQEQEQDAMVVNSNQSAGNGRKRKASDEEDSNPKRNKPGNDLPEGFFDAGQEITEPRLSLPSPTTEIQMPSRPATPSKPPPTDLLKRPEVDENEWAAFEADIAAAEVPMIDNDAIISAPAMSATELAAKSVEETSAQRKERQEAELEGDKEDAARKMEEELEEMESLEQRVKRMREKREDLRKRECILVMKQPPAPPTNLASNQEVDEDDDEEDDEWDAFRLR